MTRSISTFRQATCLSLKVVPIVATPPVYELFALTIVLVPIPAFYVCPTSAWALISSTYSIS